MSNTDLRVSACVDCTTTIIGDRMRCPSCHDRHASLVAAAFGEDDDAVTAPRPRSARSWGPLVVTWVVVSITLAILGFVMLAEAY